MTGGTALIALKQQLVRDLIARPGLAGVQVHFAFPEEQIGREAIWFAGASSDNEIPVMRAGSEKVDETVDVEMLIQVLRPDGESQETADVRAAELLADVQSYLAETPQPVTDVLWVELAGWTHRAGRLKTGHGSRFELTLRYQARLG